MELTENGVQIPQTTFERALLAKVVTGLGYVMQDFPVAGIDGALLYHISLDTDGEGNAQWDGKRLLATVTIKPASGMNWDILANETVPMSFYVRDDNGRVVVGWECDGQANEDAHRVIPVISRKVEAANA